MPGEREPFTTAAKRAALAVATFGAFMTPFDGSVVNLALPTIGHAFHSDVVALGWIATSYVLGLTISVIPFGRLADIRGRRSIYVIGVALFTVASAFCGFSFSLGSLIAARFVQGVAAAMMAGNSIALLTTIFPPHERGKALGIQTAAVYIGLSLGPSVGGFLVESLGWRSVFYVNVPIGAGVIALALTKVPRDAAERRGERLDPLGIAMWGLALTMILLGLTLSEQQGGPFFRTLVGAGAALLAIFLFYETRVVSPLLDVRLFKNISFAFSTVTALLNYSAVFGVSFIMSLYLQLVSGFRPEHAGFILLAQPVVMAALSPLTGRLSDKIQPRVLSSIGMALVAAAIFSLARLAAAHAAGNRSRVLQLAQRERDGELGRKNSLWRRRGDPLDLPLHRSGDQHRRRDLRVVGPPGRSRSLDRRGVAHPRRGVHDRHADRARDSRRDLRDGNCHVAGKGEHKKDSGGP
jgi:EmrB/QacA subfamily drug resistance transporter